MVRRPHEIEAIVHFTAQGTSPWAMEDLAHNEYSPHRFELADSERERKVNEQARLVADVTMAEVFRVARCPRRQSSPMSYKARLLDN